MAIDEALTRQWIRDNAGNLAWECLKVQNESRFVCRVNFDANMFAELVDDELGTGTYREFTDRTDIDAEALGLKRCAYCEEMVADPIDSAKAGGRLCKGCMRWFESVDQETKPWLDLSDQVWSGRSAYWLKIANKMSLAYDEAERRREEFWKKLSQEVHQKPSKRRITVQDDDAYDKAVDRKLERGEDWRNL